MQDVSFSTDCASQKSKVGICLLHITGDGFKGNEGQERGEEVDPLGKGNHCGPGKIFSVIHCRSNVEDVNGFRYGLWNLLG